jgi:nucleotide-binding universal stress UspA family protein
MYHKILVPLDGSKQAESALHLAGQLAAISNAEITLLRVVEYPYEMYSTCDSSIFMNPNQPDEALLAEKATFCREAEDYLKGLASILEMTVSKVSIEVQECPVVDSILNAVEKSKIDLIVMSPVGLDHNPFLMGAVANRILREAPVPVILVRRELYGLIPHHSRQPSTSMQNDVSIHPDSISRRQQIVLDT